MKIIGTKAKDTLIGTIETDVMNGKRGADVLVSNGGDDVMKGGKGADTFVFYASQEGSDAVAQILDFQPGKDNILIVAEGFPYTVVDGYHESTGDVGINLAGLATDDFSDTIANIGARLTLNDNDVVVA